jgi:DNA-binding GntR family transcriptional regulator
MLAFCTQKTYNNDMNYLYVNKLSVEPIYRQLYISFKSAILSGELPNLSELPREEAVCSLIGISRVIVRRAYKMLIDEGLVIRDRGKSPVVYRRPHITIPTAQVYRVDAYIAHQYPLSRRIVVSEMLSSVDGFKIVGDHYHILIVGLADRVPVYRQDAYLPMAKYPKFYRHDLSAQSILDLVRGIYGYRIASTKNYTMQRSLSKPDAKLINLEAHTPMLRMENTFFDDQGQVLAVVETIFPGPFFDFTMQVGL